MRVSDISSQPIGAAEMVFCNCDRMGRRLRGVSVIDLPIPNACDIMPCCDRVISSQFVSHNGLAHIAKFHLCHPSKSNFKSSDPVLIQNLMRQVVRHPNVVLRHGPFVSIKGVFDKAIGVSSLFPFSELTCLLIVIKSGCNFDAHACNNNCFAVTAYPISSL